MRVELNGIELDVLPLSIRPTYQSNDLNEIQNRNLSNAVLKFPKTPRNVEFFEYLDFQGSESEIPYRITSCTIYVKNEIHLKGVCKIRRTTKDYYEGIAKEEAGNIFDLIKDKKLSDLDLSGLNHYLNETTWQSAIDNTDTYAYALGDFGSGFDDPLQIARQSPSMFKYYLWNKIWEEAGVLFQGDVFNDINYQSEVISIGKGHVDVGEVSNYDASDFTDFLNNPNPDTGSFVVQNQFNVDLIGSDERVELINGNSLRFNYPCRVNVSGVFQAFTGGTGNGGSFSTSISYSSSVRLNGFTEASVSNGGGFAETIEVVEGDILTFNSSGSVSYTDAATVSVSLTLINVVIDIVQPYIDFNDLIGDISQTAFVKDLIKSYGMMFRIIPWYQFTGATSGDLCYDFTTMEYLLNDRQHAEDWSDKRGVKIQSEKSIGSYGVNNSFAYKYEEGVEPFLDYTHISTNENQKEESVLLSSIYTAALTQNNFQGQDTVYNELFELNGHYYKLLSKPTKTAKTNLVTTTFDIIDGDGNTATVNGLAQFLTNTGVDWEFFHNNYFNAFTRILDKPNKDKTALYLTPTDIKNKDFFRLKYFSQEGRYYYLNKILNFREGYNTICEMIEVVGFDPAVVECMNFETNNNITATYA